MPNWLRKPKDWYNAAVNVCSSVGPFLISQSDRASEAFARHKGRMANADAIKTLVVGEAESIASVRDSLRKKYVEASPEERIRIRRDIADAEADIQHLKTIVQALHYLPDFTSKEATDPAQPVDERETDERTESVSEHWMDKFNQLVRSKNEPWRQDLLARALAAESANPGSTNARALWVIGTLEESKFQALATILDISSVFAGGYMVPGKNVTTRDIPHCELGNDIAIGTLIYQLDDTGLIADLNSQKHIPKGAAFFAAYDDNHIFHVQCRDAGFAINGIVLSTVGAAIAIFYERRHNAFGLTLLDAWAQTVNPATVVLSKRMPNGITITCTGDRGTAS